MQPTQLAISSTVGGAMRTGWGDAGRVAASSLSSCSSGTFKSGPVAKNLGETFGERLGRDGGVETSRGVGDSLGDGGTGMPRASREAAN